MDKILVTIYCASRDEKIDIQTYEYDNMITVASALIKFKPKRGYKMLQFRVEVVTCLI